MGTYTTNYNLFMPSVGEQGWGDLVNGNFTTIDTTMAGLNTRIGTLETETAAVEERITALEPLSIIQVDGNQTVTFPATIVANEAHFNKLGTIANESDVLGGFYLNWSKVLVSGSGQTSTSLTYTYAQNALCNDVTFTAYANCQGINGHYTRTYVTVNGTIVVDSYATNTNRDVTKSVTVSLKHGDVIVAYYAANTSSTSGNAKASTNGYLTI